MNWTENCRRHIFSSVGCMLRVCAWRGLTHLSGLTQSATPMSKLPFPAARCLARRRHAAPAERGCRPESRYQRHLYSQHNTSPANARYLRTNQQSPVYTNRGNQNQLTTIISQINIKHLHTVRVTTHIKTTAIHTEHWTIKVEYYSSRRSRSQFWPAQCRRRFGSKPRD